jgi:hypothetical protein
MMTEEMSLVEISLKRDLATAWHGIMEPLD